MIKVTKKLTRITIVTPGFLKVLKLILEKRTKGTCANRFCLKEFYFSRSFIIKKMKPHIKECKKREEKRGSYKWIAHYCEHCKKKIVWDVPVYFRFKEGKLQYSFLLETKKFLAPFKQWGKVTKRIQDGQKDSKISSYDKRNENKNRSNPERVK